MEKEEKQKERKKRQASTSSGSRFSPCLQPPIGAPILISILIVLLCAALCAALLDMSVFLIAVVGVVAGIKMLLRGILAVSVSFGGFCFYYRNGRFHAGNQYSVRGVRRILCKMDGTAVRVVYT